MGILSNKISRDEVRPGDHIYSWRTTYTYAHHGIYVDDGQVIEFTHTPTAWTSLSKSSSSTKLPCRICRGRSKSGGVTSSCLDCFLGGGNLYRYEYNVSGAALLFKVRGGTCTLAASDPPEDVLYRANFLLRENGFGVYHVLENNCETFAIYCKTGLVSCKKNWLGSSGQATAFAAAVAVIALPGPGFCAYNVARLINDVGMPWRRKSGNDVIKVPVEELVATRKPA
ncbi:unnamed protein product [Thlaspi arvense]|uniref:LRAT domain-containing protein n=1 Tax=Thlaspi arvense TaxID=13288 RepID=A0AAU9SH72_THLAR|nr:unnamed protein product [Thlaspi arvense]